MKNNRHTKKGTVHHTIDAWRNPIFFYFNQKIGKILKKKKKIILQLKFRHFSSEIQKNFHLKFKKLFIWIVYFFEKSNLCQRFSFLKSNLCQRFSFLKSIFEFYSFTLFIPQIQTILATKFKTEMAEKSQRKTLLINK